MTVQTLEKQTGQNQAEEQAPATLNQAPVSMSVPGGEFNEFSYRPVPVLAVVGLVLALLSSISIFIWLMLPLCVLAFLFSGLGLLMIRRSQGAYGGTRVALGGMFLSLAFLAGGIGYQVYAYQTEVPEGYDRLSFVSDISNKGMRFEDGNVSPPPDVAALDGKKVFLKGYIYQTKQTENLSSFLFVKDNQSCCFGANPELWDRLGVVVNGGKTIHYHAGKVAVAGTFRLNPKFDPDGKLEPIYIIDADQFTTRVSDF